MDIKKIKSFHTFIESSCDYKKTSQEMAVTIPGLRKQLFSLEAELGIKLFEIEGKKTFPTREAQTLYDKTRRIINDYNDIVNYFDNDNSSMDKPIIIGTTLAVASLWMCDYLEQFVKDFPDTDISIFSSDEQPDLIKESLTLYIGTRLPNPQQLLNQHKIQTYNMRLYASQEYLDKYGPPQTVDDLQNHKIIGYGNEVIKPYSKIDWHLQLTEPHLKSCFNLNSGAGVLRAVELGFGIGVVSDVGARISSQKLINVLPKVTGYNVDIFFSYPKYLENDLRIIKLLEYVTQSIEHKFPTIQA